MPSSRARVLADPGERSLTTGLFDGIFDGQGDALGNVGNAP
jgi:hypothetical protein